MPMIDVQRRHATVFRIRLGHTVTTNGKSRPEKLTDQIRITAPGKRVVEAFTDVYGGEVRKWQDQYEAYLPTNQLRVMILPGQSIDQWWEKYRRSVCERRCDGKTDTKSGKPCVCPADIDERLADGNACQPMTRVNVLCPDVAVLGSGALVTHSMIAAETLPQAISVAEEALKRGVMVPAILKVVEHRSRNHFIYPQLIVYGYSLEQLESGEITGALPSPAQAEAIGPGEEQARSEAPLTPVPAEAQQHRPVASVADQMAEAEARPSRRRKSTPEIPDPGLPDEEPPPERADAPAQAPEPPPAAPAAEPPAPAQQRPDDAEGPPSNDQWAMLHALMAERGIDEEHKRAFYRARWGVSSGKDFPMSRVSHLIRFLRGSDGEEENREQGEANAAKWLEIADAQIAQEDAEAQAASEAAGSGSGPSDEGGGSEPAGDWQTEVKAEVSRWNLHGNTVVAVAKRVAADLGIDAPERLGDVWEVVDERWPGALHGAVVEEGSKREGEGEQS